MQTSGMPESVLLSSASAVEEGLESAWMARMGVVIDTNTRKQRNYGGAHLFLVYQSPATCMVEHCNFFLGCVHSTYPHLGQLPRQASNSISASLKPGQLQWWPTSDVRALRVTHGEAKPYNVCLFVRPEEAFCSNAAGQALRIGVNKCAK